MRRRSSWQVLALTIASGGVFAIAWLVQTRTDMQKLGARIPSPWLLVTPVTALYFAWCWAEGIRLVTAGRISTVRAFLAICLLGPIGMALVQARLNGLTDTGRPPSARWYRPVPRPSRGRRLRPGRAPLP